MVWLNFIGTVMPPFAGIIIAHFWIIHRDKKKVFMPSGFRWTAFVSWILAVVIAKVSNVTIPAIIGLLSAIVIYAIIGLIFKNKESTKGETFTMAVAEETSGK